MKNRLNNEELKREIGLFSAMVLVVANMVGTGIFTTSGFIMQELGNPYSLLICWAIGGFIALCGALCYGELGALFPRAGGEYVFLRESFGKVMGFLSGWISLIVGFSAPIAAAAIAFSSYLFKAMPGGGLFEFELALQGITYLKISPVTILAACTVLVISLVHYHSLNLGTRVQNILTAFKICLLLLFIVAGLLLGQGSTEHLDYSLQLGTIFQGPFAVSLIFVTFAYSGWNAAAYLGSEIKNPERNIPLALAAGTGLVIILYLLLNLVFVYALSPDEMSGMIEVGTKAAQSLFGPTAGKLFSLAISLGLLSVISAMIMSGPRIYYAMAKDKVFFRLFSQVNSNRKTPASSIFLQAGLAIFMIVTTSFDSLLLYIGFTLSLFALLTVAGLMYLRRKKPELKSAYRTFGYPVTPLVFILASAWIIVFTISSRPMASLFGLGTILAGFIFYFAFQKRNSQSEF